MDGRKEGREVGREGGREERKKDGYCQTMTLESVCIPKVGEGIILTQKFICFS